MKRFLCTILICGLAAAFNAPAYAGASAEIKLKDGSTWRGQVDDAIEIRYIQQGMEISMSGKLIKAEPLYIKVEGQVAGATKQITIFKSDVISIKTSGSAAPAGSVTPKPVGESSPSAPGSTAAGVDSTKNDIAKPKPGDKPQGVFVLPMSGEVGLEFRHNEIEAIAKEADKWGPGQIIVLDIDSGGGLGIEMEQIHYTIAEVRKRHRVVAWIREAISAAAATASNCNEIYFTTTGTLGAMTGFAGGVSLKGEELEKWKRNAGEWMESGGRYYGIGPAMIQDTVLLSYDKDETTGEVTWHSDLSGKYILSDEKTNLVFNASNAVHSKFADGIADTTDDLAKLLNLPKWVELSDYGRRMEAEWHKTVAKAAEEIPLLAERIKFKGTGKGTPEAVIGSRIQIYMQLIQWWDRCPNQCFLMGVPKKSELERDLAELRRDLANLKKQK